MVKGMGVPSQRRWHDQGQSSNNIERLVGSKDGVSILSTRLYIDPSRNEQGSILIDRH
jgi:hypothetical protein